VRRCVLIFLVFLFTGCGQKPVSYREQIQPILNNRCVACHMTETRRMKVVLTSYDNVMNSRSVSGKEALVLPGSPYQSRLYILCSTDQAHFRMPPDTSKVTPLPTEELDLLRKWIIQGTKNN
jgi:hypothetical protein